MPDTSDRASRCGLLAGMLIAVWPLLVAVIGALVYALASGTKVAELGRITFFVGVLWLVYTLATKTVHVG
jgi:chromate transport protein ChrA